MRFCSRFAPIGVAAVAAVAIAGCGSSSSSSSSKKPTTPAATSTPSSTTTASAGTPKKGGSLTVLEAAGGIDSLDPGYWYYQTDYTDLYRTTQRGLYTYTSQGTTPEPDIAAALPVASDGGKTLTIKLKPNVHYSPPLQSETVTSSDVKYALERCFLVNVGSDNYVASYYNGIVGAPQSHVTKLPNIAGIQTPDPTTLVIKTSSPVGVLANANALSLPCTVPVPEKYAAKYDKGAASSYGQHQVFTGPYMIQGANTGTIPSSGYQPGKLLVLVRNPSFDPSTDPYVKAYLDQITFKGGNDITVASKQILTGSDMASGDYAAPPTDVLQQALTGPEKSQLHILPAGGVRYVSMNSTVPPFNNVNVRRAVAAILNKNALRLTRGGASLGSIATHFISPGTDGYTEAGAAAGPGFDFDKNPNGDLAVAEKYMKAAGYPSGKYTGGPVLAVADNQPPASNTALAVQSELAQIGIKLTLRQVPHATMLSKFCEVTAAKVGLCPNLGWGRDFPDPQSDIDPVFNSAGLGPITSNMAQVKDPVLDKQINAGKALLDPAARAQAWGKMDVYVTNQSYVVPWLWDNDVTFGSKDVNLSQWTFANNDNDLANTWLSNA